MTYGAKYRSTALTAILCLLYLLHPQTAVARNEKTIVALGDSLTAGLGVPSEQSYPALLQKKLKSEGFNFRVINAGVSGETTAGGLRRVSWILKNKPDIVILELGANDGLRGLSIQEMEKNLTSIIQQFQKNDVEVILAGMKIPPNYGVRYTNAFEAVYPKLAGQFGITLIPFFLEGVAAKPALNQPDGIHPTARGYEVIVQKIWPVIKSVVEKQVDAKSE